MKATKTTVHFRFNPELNELLDVTSDYLGTTKTALVEECIRLNLGKAIKAGETKKAAAAARFKKVLASTKLS